MSTYVSAKLESAGSPVYAERQQLNLATMADDLGRSGQGSQDALFTLAEVMLISGKEVAATSMEGACLCDILPR